MSELIAVNLRECCRKIGFSYTVGKRMVRMGTFPIPELPDHGLRKHRYSTFEIELYLREASVREEAERRRSRSRLSLAR